MERRIDVKKQLILWMVLLLACLSPAGQAATAFAPADARQAQQMALELCEQCIYTSEYGDNHSGLVRWEEPLRIYVGGTPTSADLETLDTFCIQLACRVPGLPNISRVEDEFAANVCIYFVPLNQIKYYNPNYEEGNWGFVTYWYNDWKLDQMVIVIATDVTDQKDRNHLIMEEITNGLGVANDHYEYKDSITYQPWTTVQALSEVDWMMLNMIYHPDIEPGMDWNTFRQITQRRINNR